MKKTLDDNKIKFNNKSDLSEGKMTYANGNIYEGEWLNGRANGKGKMIYANGDKYEGEWLNGQANGIGEFTDASGNQIKGKFANGVIHDYACFMNQDGYSYRQYDDQGHLIDNNIPKETIQDLKRYCIGYDYL